MNRFIQNLESRVLMSVSQASLRVDQATVVADASALRADVRALATVTAADTRAIAADLRVIAADLKGANKTNAPLLRSLRQAEAKTLATLRKDQNALLNPGVSLARRSASSGAVLLRRWSPRLQATVTADMAALQTVAEAPLAKLQADLSDGTINVALDAMVAANPGDAALATDVAKLEADTTAQRAVINTAAVKFQTDLGGPAADLASIAASPIFPNLLGIYVGPSSVTAGIYLGYLGSDTMVITSQGSDGSLGGTVAHSYGLNQANPFVGKVSGDGSVTGVITNPDGTTTNFQCALSGLTISGTFSDNNDDGAGTFSFTLRWRQAGN